MILHKNFLTIGLTVILALGGGAALRAQESDEGINPDELFASAKALYGEKKYGKALSDLNLLVGAVGKLRVKQLQAALPAPPAGWKADEASGEATAGGLMGFAVGTSVKRTYHKGEGKSGGGEGDGEGEGEGGGGPQVDVELMSDSPMVAAMAPLFANPALIQGNPDMTVFKWKGRQWMLEMKKGAKSGKLTTLLHSNTALLTLGGDGIERAEFTEFGKGFDAAGIEKALQE